MKSYFTFSKQQRNGIFLLVIIIIVLQCAYFYLDFSSDDIQLDGKELLKFQKWRIVLKKLLETFSKIIPKSG